MDEKRVCRILESTVCQIVVSERDRFTFVLVPPVSLNIAVIVYGVFTIITTRYLKGFTAVVFPMPVIARILCPASIPASVIRVSFFMVPDRCIHRDPPELGLIRARYLHPAPPMAPASMGMKDPRIPRTPPLPE